MRYATAIAIALVSILNAHSVLAQQHKGMKPTAPGAAGDPVWQGRLKTSDGRTFVTDGGMAIDAALAKPASLPEREVPGAVLEKYFAAVYKPEDECRFSDLKPFEAGKSLITPSGIPLNATYINFLRRILPVNSVRFRVGGEYQPVVILSDGKPVGVLMPVKK
jgi:hypothetical protein